MKSTNTDHYFIFSYVFTLFADTSQNAAIHVQNTPCGKPNKKQWSLSKKGCVEPHFFTPFPSSSPRLHSNNKTTQSSRVARGSGFWSVPLTVQCLRNFLGITMFMHVVKLPDKRMYWAAHEELLLDSSKKPHKANTSAKNNEYGLFYRQIVDPSELFDALAVTKPTVAQN